VIIGAGKTAIDACLWLLEIAVPPSEIRWIKPREAWLTNRVYVQSGALVGKFIEGLALQLEAARRPRRSTTFSARSTKQSNCSASTLAPSLPSTTPPR
jgi:hypothetical protein